MSGQMLGRTPNMEFYVSRLKLAKLLLMFVALVTASAYCTTLPETVSQVMGWFGVAFFSLGFVVVPARFWHNGPAVVIDADGIADHRHGLRVPWSEVRSVWVADANGGKLLYLDVDEPMRFSTRVGVRRGIASALSGLNQAAGFAAVCISFQELTPDIEAARAHIEALGVAPRPAGAA